MILYFGGSFKPDSGAEKNEGSDHLTRSESDAENAEPTSSSGSEFAGPAQGGADADRVLKPLKLAFETKNTKLVELALDCFHVGAPFCS